MVYAERESSHETLTGRVPGALYDERGNAVAVRAEAFNRLPASRRPRLYDHRGLRVVRINESVPTGTAVQRGTGVAEFEGRNLGVSVLGVIENAFRLLLRVMLLLARLV